MKGTIQHDTHNGVEGVGRKLFGASDEIAGGIVHERIDFAELLLGLPRGGFNGSVIANVTSGLSSGATKLANFLACRAKRLLAPAHQEYSRAQLRKAQCHGTPKSSAAASKEDDSPFQQIFLKHFSPP